MYLIPYKLTSWYYIQNVFRLVHNNITHLPGKGVVLTQEPRQPVTQYSKD